MIPIIHRDHVAFYYEHVPQGGEARRSKYAKHIDGRPMEPCSPIRCDTCGEIVNPSSLTWTGKKQ